MIKTWALTDIGLVRRDNQDAYGIVTDDRTDHTVCVVCDGMGGSRGGALASNIAVTSFLEVVKGGLREGMSAEEIDTLCQRAVHTANTAIRAAVAGNEAYTGMGTTLVSAVSSPEGVVVHNIGDSRAYYLSRTGIRRVSRDHSLVETLVERGEITEEQARTHPHRNYITRALGPEAKAESDSYVVPMEKGDFLLLCTDGLSSTVTDREMYDSIVNCEHTADSLHHLLERSKENGAPDNVTAVLMQIQ